MLSQGHLLASSAVLLVALLGVGAACEAVTEQFVRAGSGRRHLQQASDTRAAGDPVPGQFIVMLKPEIAKDLGKPAAVAAEFARRGLGLQNVKTFTAVGGFAMR